MECFEIIQRAMIGSIRASQTPNDISALPIYSHIPENAKYPFIRLSSFTTTYFHQMNSVFEQCKMKLEVFSNQKSSSECIGITTKLRRVLHGMTFTSERYEINDLKITEMSIEQLRNTIWRGQILSTVHVFDALSNPDAPIKKVSEGFLS